MAAAISENAKVQRPGVCNAMETLLVHRDVAADFLPASRRTTPGARASRFAATRRSASWCQARRPATAADWPEEYLDLILAVRVVGLAGRGRQITIARYGSSHTEAIVTDDEEAAERFLAEVDSSTVLWNASTRFADGGEFGFGAEIGISTDKLHARGPMALEELTIYKYVARGTGQVRR